jgi:hypothetical protein
MVTRGLPGNDAHKTRQWRNSFYLGLVDFVQENIMPPGRALLSHWKETRGAVT